MKENTADPNSAQPAVAWWDALTLAERLPGPTNVDEGERAARRWQRWREQTTYLDDAAFAAYFAALSASPDMLRGLLTETAEQLYARLPQTPSWCNDLNAALSAETHHTIEGLNGFLLLVEPVLLWAVARTRSRLAAACADEPPFSQPLVDQVILATLAGQLGPLVERTLVLEMHVARLQGQLSGETPAARFAAFAERLRDAEMRSALFTEYPVLARQVINRARQTSDAVAELLERLAADWPLLVKTFFAGQAPGQLTALTLGEGDTHGDGRTVAILTFAGDQKLVYKPRSLAVDALFQHLLAWLNARGADPAYRLLTVLERDGYGWVEFIATAACRDAGEVERFYFRQGGYLALLHALYAGDFHFENLLAAGEHPMLIDLEALFHPSLLDYDPARPEHLAQQAVDDSALSVSMLPQRLRFHGSAAAVDISGMGAGGRQTTPDKLPTWEGAGTDAMRLRRQHLEFTTEGHRPVLDGEPVDVSGQGNAVARGFAQIYGLLRKHRDELLAPDGLLAQFGTVEVRIIARATRIYSLILQENSHPDLLRSALERDRFYSVLWRDVAHNPRLARIVRAEVLDLHNGDVPIFHARPGARHLWTSRGERIADYLPQSGLERVAARLAGLNDADLARQLWYIAAAFATTSGGDSHATVTQVHPEPAGDSEVAAADPAHFLAAARAIGDRLEQTAYRHAGHAVWIGLGLDGGENWSLNPLTMQLYDGHAGVALFLAYLGASTGDDRYTELAAAALATLRAQVAEQRATFFYPGGFSGWGGIVYTLTHLGALWRRPDFWQEATKLATLAATRLDGDAQYDIIGGAAGYIAAVAALWHCTNDDQLLACISQAADHLIAHAQPQAEGVGWIVPGMGGRGLAGFSHGAAGIAWALLLAARITGEERYRSVAAAALRYERTLFVPAMQNWRDLRGDADAPDQFMHAWCHGAPGIGLARLGMWAPDADARISAEIDSALQSTAAHGFEYGHSLCHGNFGNLELFITAAAVLQRPALLGEARKMAANWLAAQPQTGWRCGVPGGVETPGLMVGLAGIGYELLRLADPAAIPTLLLLAPPAEVGSMQRNPKDEQ